MLTKNLILIFLTLHSCVNGMTYIASAVKQTKPENAVAILLGIKATVANPRVFEKWYKEASEIKGFKEAWDKASGLSPELQAKAATNPKGAFFDVVAAAGSKGEVVLNTIDSSGKLAKDVREKLKTALGV